MLSSSAGEVGTMCCVNWKTKAFFPLKEGIINGVSAAIDDVVRHLRAAGTLRQQSVACWLRSIIISSHSSTICRQHRQAAASSYITGRSGNSSGTAEYFHFMGKTTTCTGWIEFWLSLDLLPRRNEAILHVPSFWAGIITRWILSYHSIKGSCPLKNVKRLQPCSFIGI